MVASTVIVRPSALLPMRRADGSQFGVSAGGVSYDSEPGDDGVHVVYVPVEEVETLRQSHGLVPASDAPPLPVESVSVGEIGRLQQRIRDLEAEVMETGKRAQQELQIRDERVAIVTREAQKQLEAKDAEIERLDASLKFAAEAKSSEAPPVPEAPAEAKAAKSK